VRLRRRDTGTQADARRPADRQAPADAPGRAWNLWELERLAQGPNGDPRAEERRLLLLHLRDVADTSGYLPVEFDPLIRDVFGAKLAELGT